MWYILFQHKNMSLAYRVHSSSSHGTTIPPKQLLIRTGTRQEHKASLSALPTLSARPNPPSERSAHARGWYTAAPGSSLSRCTRCRGPSGLARGVACARAQEAARPSKIKFVQPSRRHKRGESGFSGKGSRGRRRKKKVWVACGRSPDIPDNTRVIK